MYPNERLPDRFIADDLAYPDHMVGARPSMTPPPRRDRGVATRGAGLPF